MFETDAIFNEAVAEIKIDLTQKLVGTAVNTKLGAGTITEVIGIIAMDLNNTVSPEIKIAVDINGDRKVYMLYTALNCFISLPEALETLVVNYKEELQSCVLEALERATADREAREQAKAEEKAQALKERQAEAKKESIKKSTLQMSERLNNSEKFSGGNEFFISLGWLAKHAKKISATMPDYLDSWFMKNFGNAEHKLVDSEKVGPAGYTSQWTLSMTIDLDTNSNMPAELYEHLSTANKKIQSISDTSYIFGLVRDYGFQFGKKQNIEQIKKYIPDSFYDSFEYGYNMKVEE